MTSVRAAKSKGNQFEYDCQASLKALFPDIYRTSERGFQQQYDLRCDGEGQEITIECKRLKGISWNQCEAFYIKLKERTPETHDCYLLFKSNNQPCLVFTQDEEGYYRITRFQDVWNIPFIKHESTRPKKILM